MKDFLILVAHGTRDPEGVNEFRAFAGKVGESLHHWTVTPSFLELAEPSVLDAIERAVSLGASRVLVMPLLLAPAGHMKNDVASAVQVARQTYPAVEFYYGAPLGVDARILSLLDTRLREAASQLAPDAKERTAGLLVGRGSSDPDGNSDVYKMARLLWEGRLFSWVEVCFAGVTTPSVAEGVARCVALGADHIIVLPYFLFTGLLLKRIREQAESQRERFQRLEVLHARHLGGGAEVLDLLLQRIQEALEGKVMMNCDLCKYRRKISGFEHEHGAPQVSDHYHGLRTRQVHSS